jgi:hypothetical protein
MTPVVAACATVGRCHQGGEGMRKTIILALLLACGTAQAAKGVKVCPMT